MIMHRSRLDSGMRKGGRITQDRCPAKSQYKAKAIESVREVLFLERSMYLFSVNFQ